MVHPRLNKSNAAQVAKNSPVANPRNMAARNLRIESKKGPTGRAAKARSKAVKPAPMVSNRAPARNLKAAAPVLGNPSVQAVKGRL